MAINSDFRLSKVAQVLGLKRRFFESNKSLARRVLSKMEEHNPSVPFFRGLLKALAPPVCIKERRIESKSCDLPEGGSLWLVGWEFTYSDGVAETVTKSERRK